ncbi:ABC transporter permease [Naumannella sp. ID2617S]|nr:ABC transporter permease [Naumannella sp. ID2617S]
MSALSTTGHYVGANLAISMRQAGFLVFTIALPVGMYLMFSKIFGSFQVGPTDVNTLMMVSMAIYGALGAAISAGAQLQVERRTGWFRQLMLSGLTPAGFLSAKIIGAMVQVLPAILAVFVCGLLNGVRLQPATWLAVGVLVWISLLPMVILGVVIALWFQPSTVGALSTILLLALSMLGGLWVPVAQMPTAMQGIAKLLPTYWMNDLAVWPIFGGELEARGPLVLVAWLAGLTLLGAVGYRRAVRSSRR